MPMADDQSAPAHQALPPWHVPVLALVLFVFWLGLSGERDTFYLLAGAGSATLVAWLSRGVFAAQEHALGKETSLLGHPWWRLLAYLPWLGWQILISNLKVAVLVLSPKPRLDPVIVRFTTRLSKEVSRVSMANSITLTPGTVTIRIEGDEVVVHALAPDMAELLVLGELQRRVARLFGDEEEASPTVSVDRPR